MDQPKDFVQVADGRTVNVTGTGKILNHNSSLVPQFENSLLSVSEITKSNNAIAIFTDSNCHIIKLNKDTLNILNNLILQAKSKNEILVDGKVINGLYMCDYDDIKKTSSTKSCYLSYGISKNTVTSDRNIRLATASYYSNVPSVSVDSITDLVRFFHEVWNHASMELMCLIVKHKLVLN